MPSLSMKKKSSMWCVRERNCLRVCNMSNTVSKRSHLKFCQSASDDDASCLSSHGAFSGPESNIQDNGAAGATSSDVLLSAADSHFEQPSTLSDDSSVIEGMESTLANCTGIVETMFSPTQSQIDSRDVPNSHDDTGVEEAKDLSHLHPADESDGNSGSSSDYQTCNISDVYILDMVHAGSGFDGSFMCDDIAEAFMFSEHDPAESNIFFDVERHLNLPFLDASGLSEMLDSSSSEESRVNYDNPSFMFAIHQICPSDQEADCGASVDSDEAEYFDPHSFIRNLPDLSDAAPNGRPTILSKESLERKPITLVLDLDETLVHSTLEHCENADFTFTVFFNMKEQIVYVKERPHLRTFLRIVAEMFEVVVFTASQSIYAEQLLDVLDPDGKLISGRAYRESCIFSDGSYTKDLTVLGLDLAKVIIIDNSPQVFRFQVNNGIPIKSWFDDPSDSELIALIPFLETLVDADDVRPLVAKRFSNKE